MVNTNTADIQPVILCGGSGTRLWPLSRKGFPKQFLCIVGNESLFQQTALRLANLESKQNNISPPFIVSGDDHRFLVVEQLREVGITLGASILEPFPRNTAPALTLAALAAVQDGRDPVMLVMPADHVVADSNAFTLAMQQAVNCAIDGGIVMLGITPTQPETGYGYIQTQEVDQYCDKKLEASTLNLKKFKSVIRFIEKPNINNAKKYINKDNYYWNAGVFVLKASVWLKALEQFRQDIFLTTKVAWENRTQEGLFVRPGKNEFDTVPKESIDYAVIERCPGSMFPIKMVPLDAGWSDLGSWNAIWDIQPKDLAGNVHHGDVLATNCNKTFVYATSRLVTLVGVKDVVVVETPDAVLVANKSMSQDVKNIVQKITENGREENLIHKKIHRPWGWYETIDQGKGFKVKRIQLKPNAAISLQKHQHRAEHWVVVTGAAEITNGEHKFELQKNQSTYIPTNQVHRLRNPYSTPLEIIEIQTGEYLSEEDIIRIEDDYGRS
jgi:mannose-1-phosphate guanylyltransferase / mannose-6-phosphate isomerase